MGRRREKNLHKRQVARDKRDHSKKVDSMNVRNSEVNIKSVIV